MAEEKLSGARVLVTGGAGFIGSHIVEELISKGADVTVYDDFSTGSRENLDHIRDDITLVEGNILDQSSLRQAVAGHDIVSHQAAQLEITTAMEDPQTDLETNTEGSLNVFEAAMEEDVSEVVYASSACVYGQAENTPQSENHPTNPNWPYGVSKLAVEKYARIYSAVHNVPFTGLRYGITYGPREWYGRVMTVFLKRALNGQPPVVWGGQQERDFVHVSDAARLHTAVLEKENTGASVYNVGTGVSTTIETLAKSVLEITDLDEQIVYEDIEQGGESEEVERDRLPAELQQMVLDPTKAQEDLEWDYQVSLSDGLAKQYEWLQQNAERWQDPSY